jgi:hypothetical protein
MGKEREYRLWGVACPQPLLLPVLVGGVGKLSLRTMVTSDARPRECGQGDTQ